MIVADVRCHVLLDPDFDPSATSSAQDTIVVEVEAEDGTVGIGETDLNAWIARACIEAPGTHTMDRGLRSMLVGRDCSDAEQTWRELYVGTAMSGRRGAVVHALGALDIALWDLRGKLANVPTWRLLGEAAHSSLTPYASLQPEVSSYEAYRESIAEWAQLAIDRGFRAVKVETGFSGPYVHRGLEGPDERVPEVAAAVREVIGPDITLLVDVQYAYDSVERALRVAEALAELDVYFFETPLWSDDIEGLAELRKRSPVRIAAGEWLATRHEFAELLAHDAVDVVQPDTGRVGGITEALAVCAMAAERDLVVVPHAWKTGLSVAVAAHLATVTPHMPFFEFLPAELCESRLRRDLVREELSLGPDGLALPERPGLGVELEMDAVSEFEAAAARLGVASHA